MNRGNALLAHGIDLLQRAQDAEKQAKYSRRKDFDNRMAEAQKMRAESRRICAQAHTEMADHG